MVKKINLCRFAQRSQHAGMPVKAEVFLYALLYFSQNTISLHLVAGEMVVQTPTLSTRYNPENETNFL